MMIARGGNNAAFQRVRQRMALDPNLDFTMLRALYYCAPDEVLANPALPLHLLAEPSETMKLIGRCRVVQTEHARQTRGFMQPVACMTVSAWFELENSSSQRDLVGGDPFGIADFEYEQDHLLDEWTGMTAIFECTGQADELAALPSDLSRGLPEI